MERALAHHQIVGRRLSSSRRITFGAVILGSLALLGIFAEIIAGPAPILAIGGGRVLVLPAITRHAEYERLTPSEVQARHARDVAIWPIVRAGPLTKTDAGPDAPASLEHPLGTDALGRDLCARLVYGTRNALGLSLGAVLVSMLLGVALGGLAGVGRGFWNDRLVRLVETVDTFPAIIVVALVRAIERQPSALSLVLAVAAVRWAEVARLVRAESLRASTEDYALAAKAIGASPLRVFYRHILPNVLGPVIVSSVFGIGSVVLLEAAISFLAMGAPAQAASWGETLAEGARAFSMGTLSGAEHVSAWGLVVLPCALLLMTVGATYLLADALRDAIDPRAVRASS